MSHLTSPSKPQDAPLGSTSNADTNPLYKVLENKTLTAETYCLRLERKGLPFKAGQLLNVGVPGMGVNREYSIYSSDKDPFIDILIREVTGGTVSVALKKCKPGDIVEVHGPYGEFALTNPTDGRKYLFIGTGTGVAPFHCFAQSFPDLDYTVLHGVRRADEQYDRDDYPSGRYISCVTQEDGGDFKGRVTDYLRKNQVDPSVVSYLCGNRAMINECYGLLRDQGVKSDNIMTEVFF